MWWLIFATLFIGVGLGGFYYYNKKGNKTNYPIGEDMVKMLFLIAGCGIGITIILMHFFG